jgi:hypothetical protein
MYKFFRIMLCILSFITFHLRSAAVPLICLILQELAFSEKERTRNKRVGLSVCKSAICLRLEDMISLFYFVFLLLLLLTLASFLM